MLPEARVPSVAVGGLVGEAGVEGEVGALVEELRVCGGASGGSLASSGAVAAAAACQRQGGGGGGLRGAARWGAEQATSEIAALDWE